MPPFGNWYGMQVYFDLELAHEPDVTFAAGRHDESVTVPTLAIERFSRAVVVRLAEEHSRRKAAA